MKITSEEFNKHLKESGDKHNRCSLNKWKPYIESVIYVDNYREETCKELAIFIEYYQSKNKVFVYVEDLLNFVSLELETFVNEKITVEIEKSYININSGKLTHKLVDGKIYDKEYKKEFGEKIEKIIHNSIENFLNKNNEMT